MLFRQVQVTILPFRPFLSCKVRVQKNGIKFSLIYRKRLVPSALSSYNTYDIPIRDAEKF